MTVSAAASAGVLALLADGALAAGFQVSGQQFKVSASRLSADGFIQYGALNARGKPNDTGAEPQPVAVSAMRRATLTNLCQSVHTEIGNFGSVTLRIEAGKDPNNPVEAENMTVDMTQLDGNAVFTDIEIGRDAGTLSGGPHDPKNPGRFDWERDQRKNGMFAQQSDHIEITDLQQIAWATTAGTFKLKGLSLTAYWNNPEKECFPGGPRDDDN